MKVVIRLQNHGKRNHPLWWIVAAPNRKNIAGPFLEHLGYWYPRQGISVKRQVILNLVRIKHWIACGAVPTRRVQHFLNWFGLMPKPWFYAKTEQELAKMPPPPEQEVTEKKKRKLELKEKRKQRKLEGTEYGDVNSRISLVRRDRKTPLAIEMEAIFQAQEKENEYLRTLLYDEEFKKYARVRELSGERMPDLEKLKDELMQVKGQLALLTEKGKKMHPLKQAMLVSRINEIFPQIVKLNMEQEQKQLDNEEGVQDKVFGRAAMHALMMNRINKFKKEMQDYLEMLEPMTKESYAEYLVELLGIPKNTAEAIAQQDFLEFEEDGIIPTKGDLMTLDDDVEDQELDERESEDEDEEDDNEQDLDGLTSKDANRYKYKVRTILRKRGFESRVAKAEEKIEELAAKVKSAAPAVEGEAAEGEVPAEPPAQGQAPAEGQVPAEGAQGEVAAEEQYNFKSFQARLPSKYFFNDPMKIRQAILKGALILPNKKPVNPFPDLNAYIPEDYYEIPSRRDTAVNAPAMFPEEEFLRFKNKLSDKKFSSGLEKEKYRDFLDKN